MENIRLQRGARGGELSAMKLYRFRYSPYARKVQMLLDLLGTSYELVDVPYSDRSELATVTGGYIYVPVLVSDDGAVTVESRDICQKLLAAPGSARLLPAADQGPIWAYADFCDGPLEDYLFKLASPAVRDAWQSPSDRALYVLIKERKFGAGCVDAWQRDRDALLAGARRLLAPTLATLELRPFLFGDQPTLADAALYGNGKMIEEADPALLARISPAIAPFMRRLEAKC
jgi:glutathione S-transferase